MLFKFVVRQATQFARGLKALSEYEDAAGLGQVRASDGTDMCKVFARWYQQSGGLWLGAGSRGSWRNSASQNLASSMTVMNNAVVALSRRAANAN